jgi:large conductance mechanosensitive channel protein
MVATQHTRNTAEEVDVSTNDGEIVRIEETQSGHHYHKPNISVIVNSELNPVNGFVDFLREHAVVGLAIGFVIGTQVQSLVKQLVASFIDPIFQLFFGKALSSRNLTLHYSGRSAQFPWGAFVYGLLDFLFVIAAIYILVKVLKLDKLDKPAVKNNVREKVEEIEKTKEEEKEDDEDRRG